MPADPIAERIAQEFTRRVEHVSEDNGYALTLSVTRPIGKARDVAPKHLLCVVQQASPEIDEKNTVDGQGYAPALVLPLVATILVMPSEGDATPIDTYINRIAADVIKATAAPDDWQTFGGLAINARFLPPEIFEHSDGSFDGVSVICEVTYRTEERNPYQAR